MNSKNITKQPQNNILTFAWFKLGIISLGFAGLYSVVLVVFRTPQLASFFPNPHIFKSALIIHVNLSVLIWLLSITASIWASKSSFLSSMSFPRKLESRKNILDSRNQRNDIVYVRLTFLATILIAISPIAGHNPVMNNYIPMLENIIFILGLSLFSVTLLLYAINILYFFNWANWSSLINFTILSTIIMYILTWVCFWCSYKGLQDIIQIIPIEIEFYYELLFWSGGHLLQFIYTQIAMFIWITLFERLIDKELKFQKFYLFFLYLNFIFGTLIVFGHIFYDIIDGSFKEFYTNHMKYFGGIAPGLCVIGMLLESVLSVSLPRRLVLSSRGPRDDTVIRTILLCSITLFLLGGLIAINISGINVVIPAHYHGSIVGISIACMGYCYLNILGYVIPAKNNNRHLSKPAYREEFKGDTSPRTAAYTSVREDSSLGSTSKLTLEAKFGKMSNVIPWPLYGILGYNLRHKIPLQARGMTFVIYLLTFGQILHILGLALAGGYGVMRKDPNTVMPLSAKLLMGIMGGGGLIAIVGGLMFVFICGKIIFFKK